MKRGASSSALLVVWFVACPSPARHLVQRIEVFVALGMRILHRHLRTELDVFSDGFPKGLVVRQTRRIESGEIQIHTLILGQAITSLNAFGG
jgi:hypothetical protein